MLPPQLRQGLVLAQQHSLATLALRATSTSLLRAGVQSRSFWGWRRRSDDWSSQVDPVYHRFSRIRTLKTRAKLLKNLRRRGKFDWDFASKPFFTPVRWASHWDGKNGGRSKWFLNDEVKKEPEEGKKEGEEGFELSAREKEWKEKMEVMRKRIEKDPYEAIFGKRFEPFWSPLVPSWMREEMGLSGWPKSKLETVREVQKEKLEKLEKLKEAQRELVAKEKELKEREAKKAAEETTVDEKAKPEVKWTAQPGSYSYASSTSWDSWTNKTRRVEWDSVSGQTKRYEYDPISNRMIQVEAPKPEAKSIEPTASPEPAKAADAPVKSESTSKATDPKAVNIPVQQSSDLRKSIPIPPPLSQPSFSIPIGFTPAVTSVGPLRSTAVASDVPKPSALAKLPEKDEDMLTADEVRASMGKVKQPATPITTPAQKAQMERDFDQKARTNDTQIDAILKERDMAKSRMAVKPKQGEWDKAELSVMYDRELESLNKKKEKLIKDERGLFHIERQKRELQKLDERIRQVSERVEKMNVSAPAPVPAPAPVREGKAVAEPLQSSLDRMQSKHLPPMKMVDLDDSAAHEATDTAQVFNSVPKNWAQQAELLQADRVRRTAIKGKVPMTRWIDDITARRAAYEASKARAAEAKRAVDAAEAERNTKLEKANALLEAEVQEQKSRMHAHETRYAHKIQALRKELETAYKQSTVHSETHLERIRYLEEELAKAQKSIVGNSPPLTSGAGIKAAQEVRMREEQRKKEKKVRKEKDLELVREVRGIYEGFYGRIDAAHRQPLPERQKKQVVEVESDVDLGEALAKYEKEGSYVFPKENVNLENEIQAKEKAYYDSINEPAAKKIVDDTMPKLIPTEMTSWKDAPEAPTATPTSPASTLQWEDPPIYKVLAYDSGNDMMSTATTTSNFTTSETPISISQALSQLYAPARFVPYFAQLQGEGYQVIFGTKDLLVFKKVKNSTAAPPVVAAESVGLEDHGVLAGSSLVALSQKAPNATETKRVEVNPIDGTTPLQPSTGNFASPTGFVNHDPVISPSTTQQRRDSHPSPFEEPEEDLGDDIEYRHYPRVRRMEQHFTGARRRWNVVHRRHIRAEERERGGARRQRKRTFRWIVGVGVGAAGVMYLVGAAAEKARARGMRVEDEWERKR